MNRLYNYLPEHLSKSTALKEITKVESQEFDKFGIDTGDLRKQYSINTATWGLKHYEKEYGLPIEPDLDLELRRKIVKGRMILKPPGNKLSFINAMRSFIEDASIEEYFNEYKFNITLKTKEIFEDVLKHVEKLVEDMKPAHLEYIFTLAYITDLMLEILFKEWESEKLIKCGTIDINGNEFYSTEGLAFKEEIIYMLGRWLSDTIEKTSKEKWISGKGFNYKENIIPSNHSYNSEKILECSKTLTIEEG